MYCIVINKETGEMSSIARSERETMISILLDLKQPIPDWVIALRSTKQEADQYIKEIKQVNDLINSTL